MIPFPSSNHTETVATLEFFNQISFMACMQGKVGSAKYDCMGPGQITWSGVEGFLLNLKTFEHERPYDVANEICQLLCYSNAGQGTATG